MKILWQISKGLLKGAWQLIRMVIVIADAILNGMPEPSKKHKLYTEIEAQDLFYQGKITATELLECTED